MLYVQEGDGRGALWRHLRVLHQCCAVRDATRPLQRLRELTLLRVLVEAVGWHAAVPLYRLWRGSLGPYIPTDTHLVAAARALFAPLGALLVGTPREVRRRVEEDEEAGDAAAAAGARGGPLAWAARAVPPGLQPHHISVLFGQFCVVGAWLWRARARASWKRWRGHPMTAFERGVVQPLLRGPFQAYDAHEHITILAQKRDVMQAALDGSHSHHLT